MQTPRGKASASPVLAVLAEAENGKKALIALAVGHLDLVPIEKRRCSRGWPGQPGRDAALLSRSNCPTNSYRDKSAQKLTKCSQRIL